MRCGGGDLELGGRDDVLDGAGDEPPLHLVRLPAALDIGIGREHFADDGTGQRDVHELIEGDELGAQGVVDVVRVVGDVVGDGGGLRFEAGVGAQHQVGAGRDVV